MKLLYVMDPMCAWCYGFQPELEGFLAQHPEAELTWIMGGLAPDSNTPMADELKQAISSYWHQIEQASQVEFNHDYWALNTPYRSTYPACRAVIAAESSIDAGADQMVKAIQSAYYRQALNPSLEETLIQCAASIGLNEAAFLQAFQSAETERRFQQHMNIAMQLQVNGFPALFYIDERNHAFPLALGFVQTAMLEENLERAVSR